MTIKIFTEHSFQKEIWKKDGDQTLIHTGFIEPENESGKQCNTGRTNVTYRLVRNTIFKDKDSKNNNIDVL